MQPHTTNWCSYTRYIKVVLKYIQELTVNTYLKLAQLRANLVLLLLLMGCKSMSNIHIFLKLRTALSNNACYFYLEKFKNVVDPEANIVMFTTRNVIMKKKLRVVKCAEQYMLRRKNMRVTDEPLFTIKRKPNSKAIKFKISTGSKSFWSYQALVWKYSAHNSKNF